MDTARRADAGDLVGLYEGARGFIAVSSLGGGATQLLLADAASDQLRMLFPAAADSFETGPEIARRAPVQFTIRVRRSSARRVDALALRRTDGGPDEVARRVALRAVSVAFTSGGARLAGTLLLPPGSRRGPYPAVVLAHGSEASDRHSFGPAPYVLAGHGYAVLAFDKRGTRASSGSWRDVGLEPLADDVAAAARFLAARAEVDARRIGIVGFSEGGWVAPLAASRTPLVRFIVTISGGGLTKGDAYVHKARRVGWLVRASRPGRRATEVATLASPSRSGSAGAFWRVLLSPGAGLTPLDLVASRPHAFAPYLRRPPRAGRRPRPRRNHQGRLHLHRRRGAHAVAGGRSALPG